MKKFSLIIFSFLLIFLIFQFVNNYGLLESNAEAEVNPEIGKWNITLNGVDVTVTNEINASNLIYTGGNVENGYFAPGVTGTYDIVIDPKNTDVSIRYDISADLSSLSSHPNISFSISGASVTNTENGVTTYSGAIPLSSIKQGNKTTLQAKLVWTNDEQYNDLDSMLNGSEAWLNIVITAKFTQYTGENI